MVQLELSYSSLGFRVAAAVFVLTYGEPVFAEQGSGDAALPEIVRVPDALRLTGVPPIPVDLETTLKRYQEIRSATFVDWVPDGSGMLISTRPEKLFQLHKVPAPGQPVLQLTHGDEPAAWGRYLPDGTLLFSRGAGGSERYQVYRRDDNGAETRLTNGDSRNLLGREHPDGRHVLISSTQRNQRDTDLYLFDAQGKEPPRCILEVDRESWYLSDWSPNGETAVLARFVSVNESFGMLLDLKTATQGAGEAVQTTKVATASRPPARGWHAGAFVTVPVRSLSIFSATHAENSRSWHASTSPAVRSPGGPGIFRGTYPRSKFRRIAHGLLS